MSRLPSSFHRRDRKATCAIARRPLRIENLEPRMLLSAGMTSRTTSAKSAAAALTLGASADTYVSSSSPTTNYGSQTDLLVQRAGQFAGYAKATYLKFDLSGVTGAVTKAVLNLTPISVTSSSRITIRVQLLADYNDGWVEGGGGGNRNRTGPITWSNAPYGNGLVASFSAARVTAGSTVSIDVTKLIQQTFNLNRVAGFIVELSTQVAATTIHFGSRENANIARRPTLTITTSGTVSPDANTAPTVAQQPSIADQSSTLAVLSVLGADKEDAESALRYTWSVTSPTGGATPGFNCNGSNAAKSTTVTFSEAGTYVFTATIADSDGLSVGTSSVTVTVAHVFSGLSVSPTAVSVAAGGTQKFTASAVDQFGDVMAISSNGVTWTATRGAFSGDAVGTTVTYLAPNTSGTATVTATYDSRSASASVKVLQSTFLNLVDPTLAALTQSLDADGSISRADMIAILRSVENESDGVVDSQDISDLRTIISSSSVLAMPDYVSVLAKDVVYGSSANAYYLGERLGNLAVGSTAAQLDNLIGKWFYGTDVPDAGGYSYDSAEGTLYGSATPSHVNELQGELGDCYLLSALGSIADSSSAAIKNMIIDNGDGTWTVRFYYNGTADYVTVNDRLPVDSSGRLAFDGYGTSSASSGNVLWLELLEKAYAQWNETGRTDRSLAENSYSSIEGGWMGDVYEQVLGRTASLYYQDTTASSAKQTLINAISAGQAVTIGTKAFDYNSATKLYGNHAYNVLSYNSSSGKFTLYNPWGTSQPAQLTWSQLQLYCDSFAATAVSGTSSFSSGAKSSPRSLIAPPPSAMPPTSSDQPDDAATANGRVARSTTSDDDARAAAAEAVFAGPVGAVAAIDRIEAVSCSKSDPLSTAARPLEAFAQPGDDWSARVDLLFRA
jgi:hypothetical protein